MGELSVLRGIEAARRNPSAPQANAAYVKACWLRVAAADRRELSEYWQVCCRHCWGERHHYQWRDEEEYNEALRKHKQDWKLDDLGGYGYTINRTPMRGPDYVAFIERVCEESERSPPRYLAANSDHDCPRCFGHGEGRAIYHDTRYLSPAGRAIFLGVKKTAGGGIEIQTRDPDHALTQLGKHLGMLNNRETIKTLDPALMTRENLIAAIAGYTELHGPDGADEDVPLLPATSAVGAGE
jgi:hypothetical protein